VSLLIGIVLIGAAFFVAIVIFARILTGRSRD